MIKFSCLSKLLILFVTILKLNELLFTGNETGPSALKQTYLPYWKRKGNCVVKKNDNFTIHIRRVSWDQHGFHWREKASRCIVISVMLFHSAHEMQHNLQRLAHSDFVCCFYFSWANCENLVTEHRNCIFWRRQRFFFKNPVHVSDPELSIRIQTH